MIYKKCFSLFFFLHDFFLAKKKERKTCCFSDFRPLCSFKYSYQDISLPGLELVILDWFKSDLESIFSIGECFACLWCASGLYFGLCSFHVVLVVYFESFHCFAADILNYFPINLDINNPLKLLIDSPGELMDEAQLLKILEKMKYVVPQFVWICECDLCKNAFSSQQD